MAMSPEKRAAMREAGLRKVLNEYTWSSQILKTLSARVPHVAAVANAVRDGIVKEELTRLGA